ncbi:MAG TPA: LysM peptidoglycan-binding domain-containing protein [Thermoanaerobaculia bacterium]|jgi:membrane-bound lytic murein transglycosylase D|nr:LysM peptidoglycan-binding domain-containing protein [Thermoanaerobaculia bacterium]
MLPSRSLFFAIPVLTALLVGCSQAPRPRAVVPVAPPAPAAEPSPIARSTELFYSGKQAALSGDFDCAETQFQLALNAVIPPGQARPAAPDLEEFSASLYDSIQRYEAMAPSAADADAAEPRGLPDELQGVSGQTSDADLRRAREAVKSDARAGTFDIPITVNDSVLAIIASFSSRESVRERFSEGLVRAGRYMPMIRNVFRKAGLPTDLAYVAMIESSFKTRARSRAKAQGVWQFIAPTGRRYGLRSTRVVDERSDPVKATEAAAAYFRDLYDLFDDWYLAMAAYDCGEGRVARAIARTGVDNYWELCRIGALPRETRLYVPSVIAAALIDKNQEHYGFRVDPEAPVEFETATLGKPVDLRRVAKACGVAYDELAELNPELRTFVTPRESTGYSLRVPRGLARAVEQKAEALPEAAVPALRRHRVRKGETLARIARRFGVTASALAEANDLPLRARLAPRRTLVIPDREPGAYVVRAGRERGRTATNRGVSRTAYRVRKGDTLFSIATRHHTTVDKLREWNRLDDGKAIHPGERLSVGGTR